MPDTLSPLLRFLPSNNQVRITQPLAIGLGALVFISFCSRLNLYLSMRALNDATTTLPWESEREIVIVTGGSSGIGAAIVDLLAQKGIKTLILDVTEPREELRSNTILLSSRPRQPRSNKINFSKTSLGTWWPIVLIDNAGIEFNKPILGLSVPQIRRTFDVNILAHFLLVQEFLPAMVSRLHGHVVSVASLASFTTSAINVDYACTKSAALAFYEGLSQDLRHIHNTPGVRNSIFHPGWVRTPLIQKMVDSGVRDGQILEPKDVAEEVVNQIMSGLGAQVSVPSSHWILPFVRALPCWFQEFIRNRLSVKRIAG